MNVAVILAGGSGTRLGADMPKQFLTVGGRMIIEHTISVFEHNDLIDEIAVVTRSDWAEEMHRIAERNGYTKVKKILLGGKERYHSSLVAIDAYNNEDDNLLIHDGVRPLVTDRIIDDCVRALQQYGAVDVAIPATDTIVITDGEGCIADIPPRNRLRHSQTPQCFRLGIIKRAYQLAMLDPDFQATDDCGVVLRYLPQEKIHIVDGESTNIKITYPQDISLMERLVTN